MKKVFSVLAVTLFMASSLNANVSKVEMQADPCHVANAIWLDHYEQTNGDLTWNQAAELFDAIMAGC